MTGKPVRHSELKAYVPFCRNIKRIPAFSDLLCNERWQTEGPEKIGNPKETAKGPTLK